MRRHLSLFAVIFLFLLQSSFTWGYSPSDGGAISSAVAAIPGETIVTLTDESSFDEAVQSGVFLGEKIINSYRPNLSLRLDYPYRSAVGNTPFREACDDTGVKITPNFIRKANVVPDDPKYGLQTYLDPINAPEGWDLFKGDSSIVVAIIDTGIAVDHPDLQDNLAGGVNLRPDENPDDIDDPHGHGTAVAGIIGASTNNGVGIAGMCWHVKLLVVKTLGGEDLTTTLFEEAAAIDYAVSHGARVVNMSFGGPGTTDVEKQAITKATQAGVVLVASSGNDGVYGNRVTAPDKLNYPAAFPEVIGVGALDKDLTRADFSNYGFDQCAFVAVGKGVYTTLPGGLGDIVGPILTGRSYGSATGTSFAAPQVTGLAALLLMKEPWLTRDGVISRLQLNARGLGGPDNNGDGVDDYLGYGLIQCFDTLADSPVGRNAAFKVGVFPSPVFPERVYIYVQKLQSIDPGSVTITGLPEAGAPIDAEISKLNDGNYLGSIYWPPEFGKLEIEVKGSSGGNEYPRLIVTYEP